MGLLMWDSTRSYECIALRDVRIEIRLGLGAEERAAPQPVLIEVETCRGWEAAPATFADALDYDRLFVYLTGTLPWQPHVELLEQLAAQIAGFCFEDARVEACRVRIRKLQIYQGRAVPEVELYRRR